MKRCPFCGTDLELSAKFCCRCGRPLGNVGQAAAAAQTMPPQAADASESAPHEYVPPAFEPHPFEAHPYEPTDYSSIHVYGENEDPASQYYASSCGDSAFCTPQKKKSRVWSVLRAILGGLGTAFVMMLCLGAKWDGETVSAIILLIAAALLLPVGPLDRLRRRIVPKTWLRGLIIAALIFAAFMCSGEDTPESNSGSESAAPQIAITETMNQEKEDAAESAFEEITAGKDDSRKD